MPNAKHRSTYRRLVLLSFEIRAIQFFVAWKKRVYFGKKFKRNENFVVNLRISPLEVSHNIFATEAKDSRGWLSEKSTISVEYVLPWVEQHFTLEKLRTEIRTSKTSGELFKFWEYSGKIARRSSVWILASFWESPLSRPKNLRLPWCWPQGSPDLKT